MSGITSTVGLISGIESAALVDQLISLERLQVVRLEERVAGHQATQSGVELLEANLAIFGTTFGNLAEQATHEQVSSSVADFSQMSVAPDGLTSIGSYQLQTLQLGDNDQYRSQGYTDTDTTAIGTGTLTIASGGFLNEPTLIEELNSGAGIRRGSFEITDRSGDTAQIDVTSAYTVQEVLDAINSASEIDVDAFAEGDKIVLRDRTGETTSNLIVTELNGGNAATDLGIVGSVADDKLTGTQIFEITTDFSLSQLNDGNGLRRLTGAPDLTITLTDDTELSINLDDATSIQGVLDAINDHEDNGGKLVATFENERIKLEDQSGGGGSSSFTIADTENSNVVAQLGLDVAESGGVITSRQLASGMNSSLIRNLRGGEGIDTLGSIDVTDRNGNTATLDLSSAESLDEIVSAINDAETGGGTKLQLKASVNSEGTGIVIEDFSGATASNLIIADVGGSTIASDLNIAVDAAQTSVDSGTLNLVYANEATALTEFSNNNNVTPGSIRLTDSEGRSFTVDVTSAVTNIGDLIQRVNLAQGDISGSEPVLLSNLNEGAGIDTLGSIDVTDRSGKTATLDLSGATTLDDVVTAINDAQDAGFNDLDLTARVNDAGNGIIVEDSSGSTASNLIIADVGGSTIAADLGLTVDAAQTSIDGGDLNHRSVQITLNEFGDGFELIDNAGGAEQLTIEDIDADTAADLGLLGEGETEGDGKSHIHARLATVVEVESGDTLDDVFAKLENDTRNATTSIFNSGSSFKPYSLTFSTKAGFENRLSISTTGFDLNLSQTSVAQDARLRLGDDDATSFILSSDVNTFNDVAGSLSVTVKSVGEESTAVNVTRNTNGIKSELQNIVSTFNSLVTTTNDLTKYDVDTNTRGVLQGSGLVLRIRQRMDSLLTKTFGDNDDVKDLSHLGLTFTEGGKIAFDTERFDAVVAESPESVTDFFLNEDNGFAAFGESTIETLSGTESGATTLEREALQTSITSLQERIVQLDEILEVRKNRLLLQFVNMENILADLQTQQLTLSQITSVKAPAAASSS